MSQIIKVGEMEIFAVKKEKPNSDLLAAVISENE